MPQAAEKGVVSAKKKKKKKRAGAADPPTLRGCPAQSLQKLQVQASENDLRIFDKCQEKAAGGEAPGGTPLPKPQFWTGGPAKFDAGRPPFSVPPTPTPKVPGP